MQQNVSFSSVKSLDIFPGINYHVHWLADQFRSKNGQRAVLVLSSIARPIDHLAKSVALGFLIPVSFGDSLYCAYQNKHYARLAGRVVFLTPLQVPRIPLECTLYFLGYGIKDAGLNISATTAGVIDPEKKIQAYFLKRHYRENSPKNKVLASLRRSYQVKSFHRPHADTYKTILVWQYRDYDIMKGCHKKRKLPRGFNPFRALDQWVKLNVYSY